MNIKFRQAMRRQRQTGSVLFASIAMMIFVLPMLLMFTRFGMVQNKQSLRDRNIKTAREMAEAVQADYMNSFSTDWHKDIFDSIYFGHEWTVFSGLGRVKVAQTRNRDNAVAYINSTSLYSKGYVDDNNPGVNLINQTQKTIAATYFWSSDEFKFDYVFPTTVTFGAAGNVSPDFSRIIQSTNTIYVRGALQGQSATPLRGQWVVRGNIVANAPALRFDNVVSTVNCFNFIVGPPAINQPNRRREYVTFQDFRPKLEVIGPSGSDAAMGLSYYRLHSSTELVVDVANDPVITSVRIQLGAGQITMQDLDIAFANVGPPRVWNYLVGFATDPVQVSIDARNGDVYLSTSTIQRRTTLAVWGGNVHVQDNISYNGGGGADRNRCLAVLCDNNVIFDRPIGGTQNIVGFYATTGGNIIFNTPNNPTINNIGTIYGLPLIQGAGIPTLRTTADRGLAQFPPPLYPRRPRLVGWRYRA